MPEIEGLKFKIETDTQSSVDGLTALTNTLKALKRATKGSEDNLSTLAEGISKLSAALANIKNPAELSELIESLRSMSRVGGDGISAVAAGVRDIVSQVDLVTDEQIARIERLAAAVKELSKRPKTTQRVIDTADTTPSDTNTTVPTDAPSVPGTDGDGNIAVTVDRFAALHKVLERIKSALGGTTNRFRGLGTGMKVAATHAVSLTGNLLKFYAQTAVRGVTAVKSLGSAFAGLFNRIGRIALLKAVRGAISALTAGFKEGVENLYQYSRAINGTFAKSMDTVATSGLYLKNSLAAMASPIINALAPAIDFITDKIVNLYNLINQVFAKLTGSSTYTVAKKVAKTYKDVGDKTTKSVKDTAKAIKATILSFDELHVMNGADPTSSGSGSGSGTDGIDYSSMFETKGISSSVSDFVQSIKDRINAGDWRGVGEILADKVNEAVNKVQWGDIGTKIGTWISNAVELAYGFIKRLDTRTIGSSITTLFNKGIGAVNFNTFGRMLIRWKTMLADGIIGMVETIDMKTIAKSVSDLFIGMFDESREWLEGINWSELGSTVYTKIKDTFTNIKCSELAQSFFSALGTAFKAAIDFVGSIISDVVSDIKTWWDEDIKGANFAETGLNILTAIGEGFLNIGSWVMTNIVDPFVSAIVGEDVWESVKETGTTIMTAIGNGIISFLSNPVAWLVGVFADLISAITGESVWAGTEEGGTSIMNGITSGIDSFLSDPFGFIKDHIFDPIVDAIAESPAVQFAVEVANDAADWWANVKDWWKTAMKSGGLKQIVVRVKDNAAKLWGDFKDRWKTALERSELAKAVARLKDNAANLWKSFKGWWKTALEKGGLKNVVADLKNNASSLWTKFKGWWKTALGSSNPKKITASITNNASKLWSSLKSWWSKAVITGGLRKLSVSFTNNISSWWNNIKSWWANTVGTLWINVKYNVAKWMGTGNSPSNYPMYQAKGAILDGATVYGMAGNHPLIGGEAGKEAVLPLETHTEWMDTLAERVVAAMPGTSDADAIAMSVREGNAATSQRQIDLLREQNELLRSILAKDTSVEVTASDISRAMSRKSRREGSAVTS